MFGWSRSKLKDLNFSNLIVRISIFRISILRISIVRISFVSVPARLLFLKDGQTKFSASWGQTWPRQPLYWQQIGSLCLWISKMVPNIVRSGQLRSKTLRLGQLRLGQLRSGQIKLWVIEIWGKNWIQISEIWTM